MKDGSCNGLQHYAALGRDKVIDVFFLSPTLRLCKIDSLNKLSLFDIKYACSGLELQH